jgi:hypothetical protein
MIPAHPVPSGANLPFHSIGTRLIAHHTPLIKSEPYTPAAAAATKRKKRQTPCQTKKEAKDVVNKN